MAFLKWSWQFCNIPKKVGLNESSKSVLVRISLVKSREKGYPYKSKSTSFILVKVPSFPRKGVNWERSFPFPRKGCNWERSFPFPGKERNWERFQQLFERWKVLSFPRKGVLYNCERFQQFFERFERGKERKAFRPSQLKGLDKKGPMMQKTRSWWHFRSA